MASEPPRLRGGSARLARVTRERPWWRLRATDFEVWTSRLPFSAEDPSLTRLGWIGRSWNGRSEIELERASMTRAKASTLLDALRRGILALGDAAVAPPTAADVRACWVGPEGDCTDPTVEAVVVDVDLGGIILPLCIDDWQLAPGSDRSMRDVATRMLGLIAHAVRQREAVIDRERHLRSALKETVATISGGAAPLWLRMNPIRFDEPAFDLRTARYLAAAILLNEHLVWAPYGCEDVATAGDLRARFLERKRAHRRRLRRVAALEASNSEGWISESALAIIRERGLDPATTFRAVKRSALDDHGPLMLSSGEVREFLHYEEGALTAAIVFNGGRYRDGRTTYWGPDLPESYVAAMPGKRLSGFIDHPAFRSTGLMIEEVIATDRGFDLTHRIRLRSVEEASPRPS